MKRNLIIILVLALFFSFFILGGNEGEENTVESDTTVEIIKKEKPALVEELFEQYQKESDEEVVIQATAFTINKDGNQTLLDGFRMKISKSNQTLEDIESFFTQESFTENAQNSQNGDERWEKAYEKENIICVAGKDLKEKSTLTINCSDKNEVI